jgi:hypothetical protein
MEPHRLAGDAQFPRETPALIFLCSDLRNLFILLELRP